MFNLPHIPTAQQLIDISFREGSKRAKEIRSTRKPRDLRLRKSEEARILTTSKIAISRLNAIVKNFPSYEQLPEFYRKLLDIRISKDKYKKSLGAVNWCSDSVKKIMSESLYNLKRTRDTSLSKKFLGRVSSLINQISKDLDYLISIKEILESFPVLEDIPTLVVAGYPNVGKSTFVKTLTGSEIKIAAYPFTTQNIMIGHKKIRHQKYQIIDNPGLLDRPMEKRNKIELQAILAIEHLADVIFFLIDPTADVESQVQLLNDIANRFDTKMIVGINKMDIVDECAVRNIEGKLGEFYVIRLSAEDYESCETAFRLILQQMV